MRQDKRIVDYFLLILSFQKKKYNQNDNVDNYKIVYTLQNVISFILFIY